MKVKVVFVFDEGSSTWDPIVEGAVDELEAKQAFNAVVLTCNELDYTLLNLHKTEEIKGQGWRIIPAV